MAIKSWQLKATFNPLCASHPIPPILMVYLASSDRCKKIIASDSAIALAAGIIAVAIGGVIQCNISLDLYGC